MGNYFIQYPNCFILSSFFSPNLLDDKVKSKCYKLMGNFFIQYPSNFRLSLFSLNNWKIDLILIVVKYEKVILKYLLNILSFLIVIPNYSYLNLALKTINLVFTSIHLLKIKNLFNYIIN